MLRILLAEDDPLICEIYQKKFSDSGFDVVTIDSGDKVVEILKKERIDVLLLDIVMPKMNGFEVLEKIHAENFNPDMLIVISSNLSQRADRERALELGAKAFIAKADFSPSELLEEVNRLLHQKREQKKNLSREETMNFSEAEKEKTGKRKILMMEDEDVFIEMFGDKLKKDGYEVEFIKNGLKGLKKAIAGKFDLFIIDAVLPTMMGEEIIQQIKLDEAARNTPIIVLSASFEGDISQKAKELQVNSFFIKTQITPDELSKEVKKIIEE